MTRLLPGVLIALVAIITPTLPPTQAQIVLKAPPPPDAPPKQPLPRFTPVPIDAAEVRNLEKLVHGLLLRNMPNPLVQSSPGWGHQKEVSLNLRLNGMPIKEWANDGTWRRLSIIARHPNQSLVVGIRDALYPEPGRATFTTLIGLDVDLKLEQQVWRNGHRLYSGETRGRCRAALLLKCEIVSRAEKRAGSLIPDVLVRGRATEAQLFYQDVVIEHIAGIGGDGARVLGDTLISTIRQIKPDLERDLLSKANFAIVQAADTREIRVSFDALLNGQVPGVTIPK